MIDDREILLRLRELGGPAPISGLGDFGVSSRTLRRALQRLADEGRVRILGINRGCRYEAVREASREGPRYCADSGKLLDSVLREIRDSGAAIRTAELLVRERAREKLPPGDREQFLATALPAVRDEAR